jgi:DNA processing protein
MMERDELDAWLRLELSAGIGNITARLASEQGKDVFAIPGYIHSTQGRGCHALIKQGAKLVDSAQDLLEELVFATTDEGASHLLADSA